MTGLETLSAKIDEYQAKFRHPSMPPICQSPIYDLTKNQRTETTTDAPGWPETWPHNNRRGIYAIFSSGTLLYIGKASFQSIGYRLRSYFRYGPDRTCVSVQGHCWTSEPTHVVAWAVPDETFFEASALEEYLIHELGDDLPDNTTGKRDAQPVPGDVPT